MLDRCLEVFPSENLLEKARLINCSLLFFFSFFPRINVTNWILSLFDLERSFARTLKPSRRSATRTDLDLVARKWDEHREEEGREGREGNVKEKTMMDD